MDRYLRWWRWWWEEGREEEKRVESGRRCFNLASAGSGLAEVVALLERGWMGPDRDWGSTIHSEGKR